MIPLKFSYLPNHLATGPNIAALLQQGLPVTFRAYGKSMEPKHMDGALITFVPIPKGYRLAPKDHVFFRKEDGYHLAHQIWEKRCLHYDTPDESWWFKVGDINGNIDGWVRDDMIYGIAHPEDQRTRLYMPGISDWWHCRPWILSPSQRAINERAAKLAQGTPSV